MGEHVQLPPSPPSPAAAAGATHSVAHTSAGDERMTTVDRTDDKAVYDSPATPRKTRLTSQDEHHPIPTPAESTTSSVISPRDPQPRPPAAPGEPSLEKPLEAQHPQRSTSNEMLERRQLQQHQQGQQGLLPAASLIPASASTSSTVASSPSLKAPVIDQFQLATRRDARLLEPSAVERILLDLRNSHISEPATLRDTAIKVAEHAVALQEQATNQSDGRSLFRSNFASAIDSGERERYELRIRDLERQASVLAHKLAQRPELHPSPPSQHQHQQQRPQAHGSPSFQNRSDAPWLSSPSRRDDRSGDYYLPQSSSPVAGYDPVREARLLEIDKRELKRKLGDEVARSERLEMELKRLRPYLLQGAPLMLMDAEIDTPATEEDASDGSPRRRRHMPVMGDAESDHLLLAGARLSHIRRVNRIPLSRALVEQAREIVESGAEGMDDKAIMESLMRRLQPRSPKGKDKGKGRAESVSPLGMSLRSLSPPPPPTTGSSMRTRAASNMEQSSFGQPATPTTSPRKRTVSGNIARQAGSSNAATPTSTHTAAIDDLLLAAESLSKPPGRQPQPQASPLNRGHAAADDDEPETPSSKRRRRSIGEDAKGAVFKGARLFQDSHEEPSAPHPMSQTPLSFQKRSVWPPGSSSPSARNKTPPPPLASTSRQAFPQPPSPSVISPTRSALDVLADQAAQQDSDAEGEPEKPFVGNNSNAAQPQYPSPWQAIDEQRQEWPGGPLHQHPSVNQTPRARSTTAETASGKKLRSPYLKWNQDEDTDLVLAVIKWGQRWDAVAQEVPSRSYHQCRQRWLRGLKSGDNLPPALRHLEPQVKQSIENYEHFKRNRGRHRSENAPVSNAGGTPAAFGEGGQAGLPPLPDAASYQGPQRREATAGSDDGDEDA